MTDFKREETWESAKRRKAINGLSRSELGKDGLEADGIFLGSERSSGEGAIAKRR